MQTIAILLVLFLSGGGQTSFKPFITLWGQHCPDQGTYEKLRETYLEQLPSMRADAIDFYCQEMQFRVDNGIVSEQKVIDVRVYPRAKLSK